MKATSIKQIKFNRGQVSDLLSERVDMGLQNACGTVYDNIYVNRYGQIQNAPTPIFCHHNAIRLRTVTCMFDTGEDYVYPVQLVLDQENNSVIVNVYAYLLKSDPYHMTDFTTPIATATASGILSAGYKAYQFGYNILFYGSNLKPWLINIVPQGGVWSNSISLTVKPNYFDGSFDNIYVRGLNTDTPTGFTVPTSGFYKIVGQGAVTTEHIVKVDRNSAGGAFTQDLVGQVILATEGGGSLQVRSVEDGDTLYAYVLSPVSGGSSGTYIPLNWQSGHVEWVFGYEKAFGDTAGPNSTPSYPDSAIYVNQRLIFGGNDYHGSLISASRIGVINDFDPETATESDSFSTSIASKDFCRIVDFVVCNNELRIACTNGEYAMSLANLTPSGSLNGFELRSEVGMAKGTPICDCGGLTAYVSTDRDSVYGTQFSLLRDRYQPISLTSQTSNIVNNCTDLKYLKNRRNNEGNCLVGRNSGGSLFVGGMDINAGLIGLSKIKPFGAPNRLDHNIRLGKLFAVGDALFGMVSTRWNNVDQSYGWFLVRFTFGEMFSLPVWYNYYAPGQIIPGDAYHPNECVISGWIYEVLLQNDPSLKFRVLYRKNLKEYILLEPESYTANNDFTYTIHLGEGYHESNIVCAGFVRQSDWRSVEIGVGMATREINKNIIKLEGVIEPTQVTGNGRFAGLVLTPEQAKNFITLTRSKEVQEIDVDNLSNTSYTESADVVWRRAFDNPDRELHYGISAICPFLLKSITCVIEYDEVA